MTSCGGGVNNNLSFDKVRAATFVAARTSDLPHLNNYFLQCPFPCGYSGSSKNPEHTSCEYSCAGGMAQ